MMDSYMELHTSQLGSTGLLPKTRWIAKELSGMITTPMWQGPSVAVHGKEF